MKVVGVSVCFSLLLVSAVSLYGDAGNGKGEIQVLKSAGQDRPIREGIVNKQKLPQVMYSSGITILDEGFESGGAPGWIAYDLDDDGNAWGIYQQSVNPGFEIAHSGDFGAGIQYNPAGNDDWLITPQLYLPADSSITFEFWANSQDPSYPEDFNVRVSTAGYEPENYTNVIAEVRSVPDDWTHYAYDLSSFAGDSVYIAVQCVSVDEYYLFVDDFLCTAGGSLGIGEDPPHVALPRAFNLHQNSPNPFNPSTVIAMDVPDISGARQHIEVTVYDIRGRQVRMLINSELEPGSYRLHWDGRNDRGESVSSGIYLYTLKTSKEAFTRKMVVLK